MHCQILDHFRQCLNTLHKRLAIEGAAGGCMGAPHADSGMTVAVHGSTAHIDHDEVAVT
jgi:hypothetical protein